MKKKILFIIIMLIIITPIIVNAQTTEKYENGYWYLYNENNEKLTGFQYVESHDKTCYYDSLGRMQYGQKSINGYWYLFDKNTGAMQVGFKYIDEQNKTVYYNNEGKMLYGQQEIDGNTYLFDNTTGKMFIGEKIVNGHWGYYGDKGLVKSNFQYISNQNKTVYYDNNGYMLYGQQEIDGNTYLFDSVTGKMFIGEKIVNGHWGYYGDKGLVKSNFQYISNQNKTVYYDNNGYMLYGQQEIDGNTYLFDKTTGKMYTGEKAIGNYWYLFDYNTGAMVKGFKYIENQNKTVYYSNEGKMMYGLQEIEGVKYFFHPSTGAMKIGSVKVDDKVYLFNSDGKQITEPGQKHIDGYWYLITDKGEVQTGFKYIEDQNKTVYYDSLGRMQYGQKNIDGNWYLFDSVTGAMQKGFQTIKEQNKTVYYDETGKMVYGYHTIDGVKYYFNETSGAMKSNFIYRDGQTYYYFEDGTKADDWVNIAGEKYFFNSLGHMVGKNVKKVIDVSSYQNDIDWDKVVREGGVDGAILRISAGCVYEDRKLARNISEVKRLGIPYGVYIYSYAENYDEGVLYAQYTIDEIKKYDMNPTLGIYFDLESNSVTQTMGPDEYTEVVRGYMDTMNKNGYGSLTKLYTYTSYANTALNTSYMRGLIDWIAQYYHYVTYTGNYRMWQYSSTESIPGISGGTDVSVLFY